MLLKQAMKFPYEGAMRVLVAKTRKLQTESHHVSVLCISQAPARKTVRSGKGGEQFAVVLVHTTLAGAYSHPQSVYL